MGLETLFALYTDVIKSKLQALTVFTHSLLLDNCFKSIAKDTESSHKPSELLPSGWNGDETAVELYYKHEKFGSVYKLLILSEGDSCILHFLEQGNSEQSVNYELPVNDYISSLDKMTAEHVFKDPDNLKKVWLQMGTYLVSCLHLLGTGKQLVRCILEVI